MSKKERYKTLFFIIENGWFFYRETIIRIPFYLKNLNIDIPVRFGKLKKTLYLC
ncbi:hypothetical protein M2451_001190 [Dysgonomonas sp. PFB1-18]|nr:hypothetical protein [Dysgonomonas sp. PF1-14]MDH6338376.1 hypothetical protein [Dysgonomonas sp. PF1-16]MDH6379873.1 hypothetical protein [Dysgonomonas sp. PFB1-18]MDH6397037.1 hypothetical protein [Dysgonomonas sp. PF1-23]